MSTENKEDDKDLADKQAELVAIEIPGDGDVATLEDKPDPADDDKSEKDANKSKAKDKDADDDEDEDESGDARASSEAEEAEGDEAKKKRDRETSADRRKRQREARERLEKELNYYRGRNEQLERRFSTVEQRQAQAEKLTIAQAIEQVEAQLVEARRIEAEAIKEADGQSAVDAREIAEALSVKRTRLLQAKAKADRPPQQQQTTPPPAMAAAFEWIKTNKDWYDPQGGNEDSVLASAMEDRLFREGKFDPSTQAFWDELNKRLKARGIGKVAAVDEEDDDDDNDASDGAPPRANSTSAGERKDARKKPKGGPKISVNGANRALKANEVYVSPDRKAAMIELGAWDDPVLKQKLLRDYQRYDREAAANARR